MKCSVETCERDVVARKLCGLHYARLRRLGDVQADRPPWGRTEGTCRVEGCDDPVKYRGYCNRHLRRFREFGDPTAGPALRRRSGTPKPTCEMRGCKKPVVARSLCDMHYRRWSLYGDPSLRPGRIKPAWRAEAIQTPRKVPWRTSKSGYHWAYWPEHPAASSRGLIFEHTAVMYLELKRPLRRGELIHHKNGIKNDNRPRNLELWLRAHPSGQRVSDLLAFAQEIMERYRDQPQLWP